MAEKKTKTPINKSDSEIVTINLEPYATPISIVLAGLMIASSILVGASNIKKALSGGVVTAGSGTTTTVQPTTAAQKTASLDQIKGLFVDGNIYFGSKDSKVVFAEFGDPSCPYCHIANGKNPELNRSAGERFQLSTDGGSYVAPVPEMKKLVDEGKAAYVYIYFNGHGNGRLASEALYCANEQGKFWEVHDLLYTNEGYNLINNTVKNDVANAGKLSNYLSSAIDKNFMKSCLESRKYDSKISQDDASSRTYGVSGTPGFFVNDQLFAGAYDWASMKSVVDEAL